MLVVAPGRAASVERCKTFQGRHVDGCGAPEPLKPIVEANKMAAVRVKIAPSVEGWKVMLHRS